MDSASHFVIGIGLGGLAISVDPVISNDPALMTAVMIGTIVGSQAPDLDVLLRFHSNAMYIRNHRGVSHSLPFLFIWTLLITLLLSWLYPINHIATLVFWVFLAVSFHVFSDCFNTYGTQAARPISNKWISWNIIHIFDPFIFFSHLIVIIWWALEPSAGSRIFPVLYSSIFVYYIWRVVTHWHVKNRLSKFDKDHQRKEATEYMLIPTYRWNYWNVIKLLTDGSYMIGELHQQKLQWIDHLTCDVHPAVIQSKQFDDIRSFLTFTSFGCAKVYEHKWGYEVHWLDVRYRYRKQYPFVAVVLLNKQYEKIDSFVGWSNEKRLHKKLNLSKL